MDLNKLFKREEDGKTYFENGVYIGDILCDVDGYYKWWPDNKGGYLDEMFLYAMAEYLKSLNREWDSQINDFFESQQ